MEKLTGFWQNIKRQTVYRILNDNVVDCTNGQDDKRMILYTSVYEETPWYCREYNEFLEKIIKLN